MIIGSAKITFPSHDAPADGDGPRFAYNLREGFFEAIVLVVDEPADTPALHEEGGLVDQLDRIAPRVVVVTIPAFTPEPRHDQPAQQLPAPLYGPAFGSYERDDVAWLLTDLSPEDAVERDCLVFRSYIALGSYQVSLYSSR